MSGISIIAKLKFLTMRLNFYSALVAFTATTQVFFDGSSLLPGAQAMDLNDIDMDMGDLLSLA